MQSHRSDCRQAGFFFLLKQRKTFRLVANTEQEAAPVKRTLRATSPRHIRHIGTGTGVNLAPSEFQSQDAASGHDPLPLPRRSGVCLLPGPGVQGGVRPLRRLLEPDQPQVSRTLLTLAHRRTEVANFPLKRHPVQAVLWSVLR